MEIEMISDQELNNLTIPDFIHQFGHRLVKNEATEMNTGWHELMVNDNKFMCNLKITVFKVSNNKDTQ